MDEKELYYVEVTFHRHPISRGLNPGENRPNVPETGCIRVDSVSYTYGSLVSKEEMRGMKELVDSSLEKKVRKDLD